MARLFQRNTFLYNQLRHRSSVAARSTVNMFKNQKEFEAVMPEVLNSLMKGPRMSLLPEVSSWVKQLLEYTMTGGKQGRGYAVTYGYEMMEDPQNFTKEKLHTARFLGWCVEMLQAYILVVDDIMDRSITRRGKLCWYRKPEVGSAAVNDTVLIHQSVMELVEINFEKEPFYADLVDYLNEAVLYTSIGQHMDYVSKYNKEKNNLHLFTRDRMDKTAIYKTSYYSFRMPTLVSLLLIKDGKKKYTQEFNHICFELGKLLQYQNDYKDIYYDVSRSGKAGTDIQEGKLSWMAIEALERGNDIQRSIFKEYYGSNNPEHVKEIKQIYDDLKLPQVYEEYERAINEDLLRRIHALPTEGDTKYFLQVLEACFKRIY